MKIRIRDTALFFDVEGAKLVADGPRLREKRTLVLLHGGPGFDHSGFKPAFSRLADAAQIVYLDHRGNGRSERNSRERWTLADWADDLREFCDALEITKPIVLGQSFGGMVAMAYGTRHPDHPGGLILSSTTARTRLDRVLDALAGERFRELDVPLLVQWAGRASRGAAVRDRGGERPAAIFHPPIGALLPGPRRAAPARGMT